MSKIKVTIEIEDEETKVIEGDMALISISNREKNGIFNSNNTAYGGNYIDMCRLLTGQAAWIHSLAFKEELKKKEE